MATKGWSGPPGRRKQVSDLTSRERRRCVRNATVGGSFSASGAACPAPVAARRLKRRRALLDCSAGRPAALAPLAGPPCGEYEVGRPQDARDPLWCQHAPSRCHRTAILPLPTRGSAGRHRAVALAFGSLAKRVVRLQRCVEWSMRQPRDRRRSTSASPLERAAALAGQAYW